ncbi:hypothetical protein GGF37_000351 [Kickxella alabastrina]|nr:hypothetical protein GGF37_000351 [Kickxella alabastrina]
MPDIAVTFISALAAAVVTIAPGSTASSIMPFADFPGFFGTGFVGPLTTGFATSAAIAGTAGFPFVNSAAIATGAAVAGTTGFPFIRRNHPTGNHLAKRCGGGGWGGCGGIGCGGGGWGRGGFPFAANTVNAFDRDFYAANFNDNTLFFNNQNANVVSDNMHAPNTANIIA